MPFSSSLVGRLAPDSWRIRWRAHKNWRGGEPELRLLPILCDPASASVDVGANYGVYSYHLLKYSGSVIALEPLVELASLLRAGLPRVRLIEAAASDRCGTATLRVPGRETANGLATIEAANTLVAADARTLEVRLLTLDSLDLPPVGFVKIDVEGHEMAALEGARAVVERDRPTFIIEAEDRHRPNAVGSTRAFLAERGYEGFFLMHGRVSPIETFDPAIHQDPSALHGPRSSEAARPYISNFIFVHRDNAPRIARLRAVA